MIVALSPYAQGVLTPFAVIGALLVVVGLIWLVVALFPEMLWWTVKRLPLQGKYERSNAGGVVAGARRAYVLRIPLGVRLILALGGTRDDHADAADILLDGFTRAEEEKGN